MKLLDLLLGRKLANREGESEKIAALQGVPAMGLDGLASSCVVDPAQPPVLLERAVVDLGMPFGDAAEMTDQVPHLVRIGGDSNFLANARHLLCLRFGRVWLTYPARRAGKTATAGETTAAPS